MPGPFDVFQALAFDTASAVLGCDAVWTPQAGTGDQAGRVLFANPAADQRLGAVDFSHVAPSCEYREGVFDGLKASVDARGSEVLTIGGVAYYVRQVEAIHDGRTFLATLVKKNG